MLSLEISDNYFSRSSLLENNRNNDTLNPESQLPMQLKTQHFLCIAVENLINLMQQKWQTRSRLITLPIKYASL